MTFLDSITSDQKQQFNSIFLENNESFDMLLTFNYTINAWFCNITYKNKSFNNIKLTVQYNILSAYSYYLPFGILCYNQYGIDPFQIDDFETGRVQLFILNDTEI
jgi:hypothetical protein